MKTVYIVSRGEYCGMTDEGYISGVFSNKEKAKEFIKHIVNRDSSYEIHSIVIDAKLEEEIRIV